MRTSELVLVVGETTRLCIPVQKGVSLIKHWTLHQKQANRMMHRSGEYKLTHLQSSVNASWGKPLSPCLSPNELSTRSTESSICVDRLRLHLRRDRRKLKRRPTLQKRPLVDANKMDRLLQQLRTNEFIGTIDPKHHSYLSEELLQESAKQCTVNESMTRRSFAYVSAKRESSHLKASLKKVKSSAAVAAQSLILVPARFKASKQASNSIKVSHL
jgi:hypothetical protein